MNERVSEWRCNVRDEYYNETSIREVHMCFRLEFHTQVEEELVRWITIILLTRVSSTHLYEL